MLIINCMLINFWNFRVWNLVCGILCLWNLVPTWLGKFNDGWCNGSEGEGETVRSVTGSWKMPPPWEPDKFQLQHCMTNVFPFFLFRRSCMADVQNTCKTNSRNLDPPPWRTLTFWTLPKRIICIFIHRNSIGHLISFDLKNYILVQNTEITFLHNFLSESKKSWIHNKKCS